MKAWALLAVLMLMGLTAVPAQSSQEPTWWTPPGVEVTGPSQFRDAWNLRVPLHVFAGTAQLPAGTPVQVHMDLGKEAITAGWISKEGKPASFTLDPDSVRLVRYKTQWQGIHDRAPVPVAVHHDWLVPDQSAKYGKTQTSDFNAKSNPVVTLEWRLEPSIRSNAPAGQGLAAGESAYYFVYFEITENSKKSVAQYPDSGQQLLDGLYWVGAGTRLFGHHPGSDTLAPTLTIIGTQPATDVTVSTYPGISTFPSKDNRGLVGNPKGDDHPFRLDGGQSRTWTLGLAPIHFMVEATKPVIALTHVGNGAGEFIPSTDAGLSGTHFHIPPGTQAVHLIAPRLDPSNPNEKVLFTTQGLTDQSNCGGQVHPSDPQFWCFFTANQQQGMQITVTNGHPILVQDNPPFNQQTWSQAPSIHGGPVGDEFLAITLANQQGGFVVSSGAGSVVDVQDRSVTPWRTYQQDLAVPSGTPARLSGQGWISQFFQGGPTPPLSITVDDGATVRVLHGAQAANVVPVQTTPFGGAAARSFQVQAPFVVHAFYPDTTVNVALAAFTGEKTLSQNEAYVVQEGGLGTLDASKPVSVFPLGEPQHYRRYLAGQPQFKLPSIEAGDYRGHLVDVRPAAGQGIVFVEALPGKTVKIPFVVQNFGRWDGAVLPDMVAFHATTMPSNWPGTPTFEQPSVLLNTGNAVLSHVSVPIPADTPVDTQVTVNVVGTSQGNPNMQGGFSAVIFLRQHFDVKVWFGPHGSSFGVEQQPARLQPGEVQDIPFVVQNTGTGPDTFRLANKGLRGGWDTEILRNSQSVTQIGPLAAGEKANLVLRVRAPETLESADILLDTTAISTSLETARDEIRLHATLSLGRDVDLSVAQPRIQALPGDTVTFHADLQNGKEGVTLLFNLIDTLPAGWTARIVGPQELSLTPHQLERITVEVTVPQDAGAHVLGTALLRVEGASDGDEDLGGSTALTVEVLKVQNLVVTGPATLEADPGQSLAIDVQITNQGNDIEDVQILAVLPGAWNATLPPRQLIPAGDSDTATVQIKVPADAIAADVPIQLAAQAAGQLILHDITVRVKAHHNLTWQSSDATIAQPGERVQINALLRNNGNTEESVSIMAAGPGGQAIEVKPSTLMIPPGSTRVVTVEWTVPATIIGNVAVTLTAEGGTKTSLAVPFTITVPSIVLEQVILPDRAPRHGEVAFITVLLRNPSDTAAENVQVRLNSGEQLLDGVRFASVGPNGTVVAPLRWVGDASQQQPTLAWGLEEGNTFRKLGDRPLDLDDADAIDERGAPMVAWTGLLALAAVAALRRRQEGFQ